MKKKGLFKPVIIALLLTVCTAFYITSSTTSQSLESSVSDLEMEPNAVYLLLRGSKTKMGGFAREYNRFGGLASHVALGLMTDSLTVYHVNTGNRHPLRIESLTEFTQSEEENYNYFALWKLKNATPQMIEYLEGNIEQIQNQDIRFDYSFNFEDDTALYCSEFIYKVLHPLVPELFEQTLYEKAVPKGHQFFLKTDHLAYLPADFFLEKTLWVEQVFEWELAEQ